MAENNIQILDDQPIDRAELFNFKAYSEALGKIITGKDTKTPLVIGIFGDWGSGKTSLMRTLEQRIKIEKEGFPAKTIWFNAWKYDKEEAIWRALLMRILEELKIGFTWERITEEVEKDRFLDFLNRNFEIVWARKAKMEKIEQIIKISYEKNQISLELKDDKAILKVGNKEEHFVVEKMGGRMILFEKNFHWELNDLQKSLYKEIYREEQGALSIDLGKATKGALQLGIEMVPFIKEIKGWVDKGDKNGLMALAEAVQREKIITSIDRIQFMEQFQERFQKIIEKYYTDKGKRAVIFIDDLDRCIPEKAIEVLEAIKLFLDVEGCIFVLGIDRRVVSEGVRVKYRDFIKKDGEIPINGDEYLEKIIQLSFMLPPILDKNLREFISQNDSKGAYKNYHDMIIKGIGKNPRKIKRFLNAIELQRNLAEIIPEISIFVQDDMKESFEALLIEWQILSSTSNRELINFKEAVSMNSELLIKMHNYIDTPQETVPKELEPFLKDSVKNLISAFPYPWKLKRDKYLFNWQGIPGSDNARLVEFLKQNFGIAWVESANFEKSDDDNKISLSDKHNNLSLELSEGRTKVLLEIDDGRTDRFIAKFENDTLNIYDAYSKVIDLVIHLSSVTESKVESEKEIVKPLTGKEINEAIRNKNSLNGENLHGADLRGRKMDNMKFNDADLSGADLSNADLSGAHCSDTNFSNAILINTDFSKANLRNANFSGANLENANFDQADLSYAKNLIMAKNLSPVKLSKHLSGVDLSGKDFRGVNLIDTKFDGANLSGANFNMVNLYNSDLRGANLSGADLRNADLISVQLIEANLIDAKTEGVTVSPGTLTTNIKLVKKEDNQNKERIKEALNRIGVDLRKKIAEDNDWKDLLILTDQTNSSDQTSP